MTIGGTEPPFPDFSAAPNQGGRPDLYELENRAIDPDGVEFTSRADFEAVLGLEFPGVADSWLAGHPDALGLSYGYVLFSAGRGGDTNVVRDKGV